MPATWGFGSSPSRKVKMAAPALESWRVYFGFLTLPGCQRVATQLVHQGPTMNTSIASVAPPTMAQQANAARNAVTDAATAENLSIVVELADGSDEAQVAEHIRRMVAATMGHLSADAPAITRNNAERWREWALGVADGVAQTVPVGV